MILILSPEAQFRVYYQQQCDRILRRTKNAAKHNKLYHLCAWCYPDVSAENISHSMCKEHKKQLLAILYMMRNKNH